MDVSGIHTIGCRRGYNNRLDFWTRASEHAHHHSLAAAKRHDPVDSSTIFSFTRGSDFGGHDSLLTNIRHATSFLVTWSTGHGQDADRLDRHPRVQPIHVMSFHFSPRVGTLGKIRASCGRCQALAERSVSRRMRWSPGWNCGWGRRWSIWEPAPDSYCRT